MNVLLRPASGGNPKPASFRLEPRIVHAQALHRGSPGGSAPDNVHPIHRQGEMILPTLLTRVKQRLLVPGLGINAGLVIRLGRIARPAAQRTVRGKIGTTLRAWDDVLDVESVGGDVLRCATVFAAAFCPAFDRLPLHGRNRDPICPPLSPAALPEGSAVAWLCATLKPACRWPRSPPGRGWPAGVHFPARAFPPTARAYEVHGVRRRPRCLRCSCLRRTRNFDTTERTSNFSAMTGKYRFDGKKQSPIEHELARRAIAGTCASSVYPRSIR